MAADIMTGRRLGRIKTEAKTDYAGDEHGESLSVTNYRPERIHLENDGKFWYWLCWNAPDVIHLEWDDDGWRVFSKDWGNGDPHVYHLAGDENYTSTGWVDYLPLADGQRATLDRRFRYELRTITGSPPEWDLYEEVRHP